jgi:hypothetical protein
MGRTCSTCGSDEKRIQNFSRKNWREVTSSETFGLDWKVGRKSHWILEEKVGYEGVSWIQLAQDRHQWRDHVNTVMKLMVP